MNGVAMGSTVCKINLAYWTRVRFSPTPPILEIVMDRDEMLEAIIVILESYETEYLAEIYDKITETIH